MFKLTLPEQELFDEEHSCFIINEPVEVWLEHSLLSLSKWESFFEKPFLAKEEKTDEEELAYLSFMVVKPEDDPNIVTRFGREEIQQIAKYVSSSQTATTFGELPKKPGAAEVITSELIYFWMVSFNIPFECETWHLNRLFSLIKVCSIKNSKSKPMSKAEVTRRNHQLNAERRAKLNTKG